MLKSSFFFSFNFSKHELITLKIALELYSNEDIIHFMLWHKGTTEVISISTTLHHKEERTLGLNLVGVRNAWKE